VQLVLGGIKSGKSRFAEAVAAASGLPVRYLATADPKEPGMAARIAAHRARRPAEWETVEVPLTVAPALAGAADRCVLLDGFGLLLARALEAGEEAARRWVAEAAEALAEAEVGELVVVSEAVGEALVPTNGLARLWLELLGEANQLLAERAERVALVVAGRPLWLKGGGVGAGSRYHGDREVRPGELDFAVNVADPGAQPWLSQALQAGSENLRSYPNPTPAREALGRRHGVGAEGVLPTNGAAEGLWLCATALRPAIAACIHPTFSEGEAALKAAGAVVERVVRRAQERFALVPERVPEEAEVVVVANPGSPCGTLHPPEQVLALRRPGRVVVVDEAFMDFLPDQAASLAFPPPPGVVVVRSLTKLLGLAGLRVGYLVGEPQLIERLASFQPPWAANGVALAVLAEAARRPRQLAALARRFQRHREDLERRLAGVPGLELFPGAANFVLCRVGDGPRVLTALHRRGIAVRPGWTFPGLDRRYLRITARPPRYNRLLAKALKEVL
jgi:histidinol-phosphate/aromatic aminotransferase/cobyric acid decarboxylase-like protein/adenosyl cobinamide kinase/adenosyl cobinamide phosphate guanylyltransferase